jgi:anti-sigma factor RsiW
MACDEYKERLMAYLDGELGEAELRGLTQHLGRCAACREDLEKMEKIKGVSMSMRFIRPSDEVWDHHWTCIYNRVERSAAWVLLSIGAIVLGVYGVFRLCSDFFADPAVGVWVKLGVGALVVGGVALFVSVARERLATFRSDPYREVKR